MDNTVVIPVATAGDAYNIVMDLKELGLRANQEFTWSFQPRVDDYISYENLVPSTVTFTFVQESWASFIRLKYT